MIKTVNLTQSENYAELAAKATYFFLTKEGKAGRYCEIYPCEEEDAEDLGAMLVADYEDSDFTVWAVIEELDFVEPADFSEFDDVSATD